MLSCPFFPKYCTSSVHNVESVCWSNMKSYYGRTGSFGCPTCYQVMVGTFQDFVASHKSHLGQYRDASKLDIIRGIALMPTFRLEMPPPINVPVLKVNTAAPPTVCPLRDSPSTSTFIAPPQFGTDLDKYESTTTNNRQHQQQKTTTTDNNKKQQQEKSPQQQPTTANNNNNNNNSNKKHQERSPSFDSATQESQIGMLKDGLGLLNENFVKSVRRSRKEMSELIKYLTEEKANLQVRLEEMQKQIASLSEENRQFKKEEEEEKRKRRNEKEEEKRKRRKDKEEWALDRDIEQQFKESQMERRTKEIVMEAINDWNNQQNERKRQQKRDEEDSLIHTEKRKKKH